MKGVALIGQMSDPIMTVTVTIADGVAPDSVALTASRSTHMRNIELPHLQNIVHMQVDRLAQAIFNREINDKELT